MNHSNKFLAKIAFLLLGGGLFIYAASRTLDFVTDTMPPDRQYLGYLYLLATGVGAIVWLYVLLTLAEGAKQRGIALGMGVIDLLFELVLVYADTVRVSADNQLMVMTEQDLQIFIMASVIAVGLNIIAVYFFHLFDPTAEANSKARDLVDEVTDATMKQLNTPQAKQEMISQLAPALREGIMASVSMQVYQAAGRYVNPTGIPADQGAPGLFPNQKQPTQTREARTGFFDNLKRRIRNPFKPAASSQRTGASQSENNQATWTYNPGTGEAKRIFCLTCRDLDRDWTGPEICEHIDIRQGQPVEIKSIPQTWPNPQPAEAPPSEAVG